MARSNGSTRKLKFPWLALACFLSMPHAGAPGSFAQQPATEQCERAAALLHLGLSDPGDMGPLNLAQQHLQHAEKQRTDPQWQDLARQLRGLRTTYRNSFRARFPLTRTLPVLPFVGDETEYLLSGDPDRVAVRQALQLLIQRLQALATNDGTLIRLVIGPVYQSRDQPSEALRQLVTSEAALAVHGHPGIVLEPQRQNTAKAADSLLEGQRLLVSMKRFEFSAGRDLVYRVDLTDPENTAPASAARTAVFGQIRDRRDSRMLTSTWIASCLLMLTTLAVSRGSQLERGRRSRQVLAAVNSLALGAVVTLATLSTMWNIAPAPLTANTWIGWWSSLLGLGALLAPFAVNSLLHRRLLRLHRTLALQEAGCITGIGFPLGAAVVLAIPTLVLQGHDAWPVLISMTVSACAIGYLASFSNWRFGILRSLVLCPLCAIWGLGVCQSSLTVLLVVLAIAATLCLLAVLSTRVTAHNNEDANSTSDALVAFAKRATRLPVDTPLVSENLIPVVTAEWKHQRSYWLKVQGPSGTGKSALIEALLHDLGVQSPTHESGARVVRVTPHPQDAPLEAVQRAVGKAVEESADADWTGLALDVLSSLVPTVSAVVEQDTGPAPVARSINMLSEQLLRLCEDRRMVLVIEHASCLDGASLELLLRLQNQLAETTQNVLAIISGNSPELDRLKFDSVVSLSFLEVDEVRAVLTDSLQLRSLSADRIMATLKRSGIAAAERNRLPWLKSVLHQLVEADAISWGSDGFHLSELYEREELPPAPRGFQNYVSAQFDRIDDERLLLQAAATVGRRFETQLVAEAIQRDVLSVLAALEGVERNSHLIVALDHGQEFEFQSVDTYQELCSLLSIVDVDSLQAPSPLQRELHRRVAQSLLRESKDEHQHLFRLAFHCCGAGGELAEAGLKYCRKAATVSAHGFAYDRAERFLRMASRLAGTLNKPFDLDCELFLLDCERAHVKQDRDLVLNTAERVLARRSRLHSRHAALVAGRVCYDAMKFSSPSRSRLLAQTTIALAESVTQSDQATCVERATAWQLIALGRSPSPESRRFLEQARDHLQQHDTQIALLTLARVTVTLADELQRGPEPDLARAKQLYQEALSLRLQHFPHDLPGLARAHGGLGRLSYQADPETACAHFREDLEICLKLGDRRGASLMHSWLGRCALRSEDRESAEYHYEQLHKLAQTSTDHLYALVGLLRLALAAGDSPEIVEATKALETWFEKSASNSLPLSAREELQMALSQLKQRDSELHARLERQVPPRLEAGTRRETAETQQAMSDSRKGFRQEFLSLKLEPPPKAA